MVERGSYELVDVDGNVITGKVPPASMGKVTFGPWPEWGQRTIAEIRLAPGAVPVGKTIGPGDTISVRMNALAVAAAYNYPVNNDDDVEAMSAIVEQNLIAEVEPGG